MTFGQLTVTALLEDEQLTSVRLVLCQGFSGVCGNTGQYSDLVVMELEGLYGQRPEMFPEISFRLI